VQLAAANESQGTVEALAKYIQARRPGVSGYSARNLWRMSQFYETYRDQPKLSPLVTELDWTKNLLILSRCKRAEEREFYLRICHREDWPKRELERQLAGALTSKVAICDLQTTAPRTFCDRIGEATTNGER
jgi:predicted nuclease of restriction endonuclease-like (RecB) superfamily